VESPRAGSRPGFCVTRFAEAEQVLRDWQTFGSGFYPEIHGPFKGVTLRGMDGALHRRYPGLVVPAFRPSVLARWEREGVEPIAHEILDRIAPQGAGELVSEFTSRFPIQVICEILGLPRRDHARFLAWSEDLNRGPFAPEAGRAAAGAMADYFRPLIAARRTQPAGDLLSELVGAEVEGERLGEEHVLGFLRLLVPAGAETTYRLLGSALLALLTHPEELAAVAADPGRIPAVVEETLRWEPSVTMTMRVATRDAELAGRRLPAGTPLTVLLGSANRDESRWEDPAHWDPSRPALPHLGFGTGTHVCLGLHLARIELRVGIAAVAARLRNLRLDASQPRPVVQGYAFRGPDRLPVRFEAGAGAAGARAVPL
jgi:cytochrome P450